MEYAQLSHLEDKEPVVAQIYERLICELQKFGPIKIEPKKNGIHLANQFGFAGVYTRKRISNVEQASANRYQHTIKLTSLDEIDDELLGWLK